MQPIHQADKGHEDDECTENALRDTCNANIKSHKSLENDSAWKLTGSTYSRKDIIEDTTRLEFLTNTKPKAGAVGSLVRFMWNPGAETSLCLVQGKICKRLDAFKRSWKETWSSNRVVVQNLIIIHQWGEGHFEELLMSMIIDL